MIRPLLRSLRPEQWVKNGFVLVAPVFARKIAEPELATRALSAFALFCLTASGIYLLNDVSDRERDRLHPEKMHRPIASGALPVGVALTVAALILAVGVAGAFFLGAAVGALFALYVAIQIGYSTVLRHVVLLDVFCIASGFVIRVLAGGYAVDVPLSSWLILTTIFLSLFLALCKRRAEYVRLAGSGGGEGGGSRVDHRTPLTEYEPDFLDQLISVTTASVVLCYSLYTLDSRTIAEFGTRNLVFTVPFVIFGIFRYLFLVHRRDGGGSPTTALLRDGFLIGNSLLWAATTMLVIYS